MAADNAHVSETQSAEQARLIGAIFVERGLVSAEQLETALEKQAATGDRLGEILVADFGVSRLELAGVLAEQWATLERAPRTNGAATHTTGDVDNGSSHDVYDLIEATDELEEDGVRRSIGEIFVERGIISAAQLERALEAQRITGKRLGEVLVEQGSLSRLDLAGALAEQWAGLQKLRPPVPKPKPEPWQQRAIRGEAPAETTRAIGKAAEDLAAIRESVTDLDARLTLTERAAASEAWRDEIAASATALASRLDGIDAMLDSLPGLAAADAQLRASVADLADRPTVAASEVIALERRVAGLEGKTPDAGLLAELRRRLDDVDERLAVIQSLPRLVDRVVAAEARIDTGARELGDVTERLESLATEAVRRDELTELRVHVDGLVPRAEQGVDALRAEVGALVGRLEQLEEAPAAVSLESDSVSALQEMVSRVKALEEGQSSDELTGRVDVLAARLEALADADGEALADIRATLDELAAAHASDTGETERRALIGARLDAMERRLEEGREVALAAVQDTDGWVPDVADLRRAQASLDARLVGAATRAELANAVASLQAELGSVSTTLGDVVNETRGLASGLDSRLADVVTRPELLGLAGDLRAQIADFDVSRSVAAASEAALDAQLAGLRAEQAELLASRLAPLEAQLARTVDLDALGRQVAGLADLEAVNVLERRLDRIRETVAAVEERRDIAFEEIRGTLGDLVRQEVAPLVDGVDARVSALAESFAAAGADLDARLSGAARRLDLVLSSDRADLEALGARVDAAETALVARVDDAAVRISAENIDRLESMRDAFADVDAKLEATRARSTETASDLRRSVENSVSSVAKRIGRLEKAIAARRDDHTIEPRLEAVEQAVVRQGKAAAAHRKSVEKGVRKGLDRLTRQVTESSGAYLGASDSFRRTLETLGEALATTESPVSPADHESRKGSKKAKRAEGGKQAKHGKRQWSGADANGAAAPVAEAESYVAFVPTSAGYRLIELSGSAPRAGDDVDAGANGILRVRRVSRSPLPFDERPCAYLERR